VGLVNITSGTFSAGVNNVTLPFTPTNGNTVIFAASVESTSYFVGDVFCGTASVTFQANIATSIGGGRLISYVLIGGTGYTDALTFTASSFADGSWVFAEYSNILGFDGTYIASSHSNLVSRDFNVFSATNAITAGSLVVTLVGLTSNTSTLTPAPAEGWNERASQPGIPSTSIWLFDKFEPTASVQFNGTLDLASHWALVLQSYLAIQTNTVTSDLEVSVSAPQVGADLSLVITDAPTVIVEPDRPKSDGLAVPNLYRTTPVSFKSPTVDFAAQGIVGGDVLEVLDGPNRGHYVIRSVQGTIVFVAQQLLFDDATPVAAVVRPQRNLTAQRKAAVVVSQPAFNQGFSMAVGTDILIS